MEKPAINPTNFDCIPAYVPHAKEHVVHAVIETPAGTRHKYAFQPQYGIMLLKQTLAEGLAWPYDYGFVPQTLSDDGEPLDILVLNDAPSFPGCLIEVRILGSVLLKKNGEENDRLLACPTRKHGVALKTDAFDDVDDLPKELLRGTQHFLIEYSAEQGNEITFEGICSHKKALASIDEGRRRFRKAHEGG